MSWSLTYIYAIPYLSCDSSFFVDVLRSQDNPNQFTFYELYKDMAAVDFHKTQPHYEKWATFKESGGTVSSVSAKCDGEFVEL